MLSGLGRLPFRFRMPCTVKIHLLIEDRQGQYVTYQAQSRCRYPALSAISTARATSLGFDCQVPTVSHLDQNYPRITSGAHRDQWLG